jgi:thymidylate synthase
MNSVQDIRDMFRDKMNSEDFVQDKNGGLTLELLGESFIADTNTIFGKLNEDYAKKELEWYKSESLNVYDMAKTPAIWKQIADKDGNINSNYGWCIFSKENGSQYTNALRELRKNKDSRRASMIYTRPTMHTDYNKEGMSDFMCTNAVTFEIRNNELHCVVQMRSNDLLSGYKNDSYWHMYVLNILHQDLIVDYPELKLGNVIWNSASLHIYQRQFFLLYNYIKTGETTISKQAFQERYFDAPEGLPHYVV